MTDEGERLAGGGVAGAVRVGDTVRRRTGPWTPAIHALLDHLAARDVPAVPRVHGIDEHGREILDHLPGEVIDVECEVLTEARLAAVGRWLRSFHDAVRTYRPGPQRWYFGVAEPADDEIVCHHDVAPYNMAFDGDDLVGVFDWEMASPGPAAGDLAFLAWNGVPLFRAALPDADVARRLRLLTDAYGDPAIHPAALLELALERMRTAIDRIEAGQRASDEGMLALGRVGEPAQTRARIAAAAERVPAIRAALDAA